MCCPNTLQWQWRICVDLRWLNVCNGCCFGAGRTVGTFVLLCVHLNWAVLLVIDAIWGCNLILVYIIHYNHDDGSALIFMYAIHVVLSLDEQNVRLYCLNWAVLLLFDAVWGRNLTLMRCHAFVEYMERVSYWPSEQTGRTFILLELGGVMGVWCSTRS